MSTVKTSNSQYVFMEFKDTSLPFTLLKKTPHNFVCIKQIAFLIVLPCMQKYKLRSGRRFGRTLPHAFYAACWVPGPAV